MLENTEGALPFKRPKFVCLLMLDGWGVSPRQEDNPIRLAEIPNFKKLVAEFPSLVLTGQTWSACDAYAALGAGSTKPRGHWSLAGEIAQANLTQLHLAEADKFALVTNFFNHQEKAFAGETDILSEAEGADKLLEQLRETIKAKHHDFILLSLSDLDRDELSVQAEQIIPALEKLDERLPELVELILANDGLLLISSAYGRLEEQGTISNNPVPLIFVAPDLRGKSIGFPEVPNNDLSFLKPQGSLLNLPATILKILGVASQRASLPKSLL